MNLIPLQAIPNQSFSVTLEGNLYALTLRTIQNGTYADITLNGNVLITGTRCVVNKPLLPYPYLEGVGGNFAFVTQNSEYPNYAEFGTTQALYYVTVAEVAAARA